jgi:hypothetical protein
MRITDTGNVGIGTAVPTTMLDVKYGTNVDSTSQPAGPFIARIYNATNTNQQGGLFIKNNWANTNATILEVGNDFVGGSYCSYLSIDGVGNTRFKVNNGGGISTDSLFIQQITGNVGIGITNPTSKLEVVATIETDAMRFFNTANSSTGSISLSVATSAGSFIVNGTANAGVVLASQDLFLNRDSSLNCAMVVKSGSGNVGIGTPNPSAKLEVNGSLAKSSGTFDIGHPLYPDTNKRLVHSFIEGPRCDLIYRGKTTLVNGFAVVDINKECTHSPECAMDEGTFEALCDNAECFLQNKTGFTRVIGVITGGILTITAESENATDTIVWMVIAERADRFIKQWDRTNPDGYLITQYSNAV